VGARTALGDWRRSFAALAEGAQAIGPAPFDATGFPCTVAAAVPDEDPAAEDRRLSLCRQAAREALEEAALVPPPATTGVFVGAESGRVRFSTVLALARAAGGGPRFDAARFRRGAGAFAERIGAQVVSPAAVASALAREIGAQGPVVTVSLACASGSAAIAEAVRALRSGACDVALAGGVGADVDPLMLAGFGLLGILSARGRSCPFDLRRDGFVLGEGAAMVVLARERGDARCAVTGMGRTLDAHHLTAPDPGGAGAERAMRLCLDEAGHPRVDYVQAHGTSTPLNDAIEAAAIARTVGNDVPVSSIKGALGHWIAGAGALGLLCAVEACRSGTVLPTAGLEKPDPACPVRHVTLRAERRPVEAALANAFAFGGANSVLLVERCA
jgi:3-oxoacyl-[acyl-carrier-protein] synthase II